MQADNWQLDDMLYPQRGGRLGGTGMTKHDLKDDDSTNGSVMSAFERLAEDHGDLMRRLSDCWVHHVAGKIDRGPYPNPPRCSRCGDVLYRDVQPSSWPKEGQSCYAKQDAHGFWYYQQSEPSEGYESCLNHGPAEGERRLSDCECNCEYALAVRSAHNGYDAEARRQMPDLKRPRSPAEAIEQLLAEAGKIAVLEYRAARIGAPRGGISSTILSSAILSPWTPRTSTDARSADGPAEPAEGR